MISCREKSSQRKQSMLNFIRKAQQSKKISIALDIIGAIYIGLFLMTSLNWGFLIDLTPNCYRYDAIIISAKCSNDILGTISEFILNFVSPIVSILFIFIFPAPIITLFQGKILTAIGYLLLIIFLLIIAYATLRLLFRSLVNLLKLDFGKTPKEQIKNLVILLLIVMPTLAINTYKSHLLPPKGLNKVVNIDMWHSTFAVPNNLIIKRSLAQIKFPDKDPGSKDSHLNLHRDRSKKYPYIEMIYTSQKYKNMNLLIFPNYNLNGEAELNLQNEKWLKDEIEKGNHNSEIRYSPKDTYIPKESDINGWKRYKFNNQTSEENLKKYTWIYSPELYVSKTNNGIIKAIVKCDKNLCQSYASGTTEYSIFYEFDKSMIPQYDALNESVEKYVAQFSTIKKPKE